MREILPALHRWYTTGSPFGLATVVAVSRSAPRGPGAAMAVGPGDEVVGSVSGGCVEGAVFELAREVVESGETRVETFGYSDEDAFAVGLTCGGEITLLVRRVTPAEDVSFGAMAESVAAGRPVTVATVVDGPAPRGATLAVWPDEVSGSLGSSGLDAAVTATRAADSHSVPPAGGTTAGTANDARTPSRSFCTPSRHRRGCWSSAPSTTRAVARIGDFLGYRVTVCDARPVFATAKRFPEGAEVVVDWPHRYLHGTATDDRTVICVLTHDPKFDVPLLEEALRRPAAYIGAMGSRRTHDDRMKRLTEAGLTEAELARLRSPSAWISGRAPRGGGGVGGRRDRRTAVGRQRRIAGGDLGAIHPNRVRCGVAVVAVPRRRTRRRPRRGGPGRGHAYDGPGRTPRRV